MKNTSFARRWTKTSVRRILKEFKDAPHKYLCIASLEFYHLWNDYRCQINELARNLNPSLYEGYEDSINVLFPSNQSPYDTRRYRIEFLEHEIKRLTKK